MEIANTFLQQRHKRSKQILEGDVQVKRQIVFWITSLLYGLFAPFLLVRLGFEIIFGDVSDYALFLFLRAGHGMAIFNWS